MSEEINIDAIVGDMINSEFFYDEDEKACHQANNKKWRC